MSTTTCTPEEAILVLERLTGADEERDHALADMTLCAVLRGLGHADVADAFDAARRRVPFWYA